MRILDKFSINNLETAGPLSWWSLQDRRVCMKLKIIRLGSFAVRYEPVDLKIHDFPSFNIYVSSYNRAQSLFIRYRPQS